jgi:pimeloyl-ACP methyl ester carboxylesterase
MAQLVTRITSTDGTQIAVWRSGSGPNLILVHGTTADHTRWAQVAPRFERQFTVYAMDRRGRGASGDAETRSIAREGEDVVAVAEAIGGPVNLLGHSYGALCCIEAALRLPDLDRLVLYEPPLPVGADMVAPGILDAIEKLIEQGERETALLTFFRDVVRVPEHQLEVMRSHPAWAGRLAAAHTVTREIRLAAEYRPDLDRLRTIVVPSLLLLGGDSPSHFRAAIRQLDTLLPNSRIHEMADQQHIAMDTIPDEFARIVSSFVLS